MQDVEISKKFYKQIFDQEVVLDLGKNVTFSGGFAIQQDFAWLTDIDPASVNKKSHNMELYFEVDDFDEFLLLLEKHKEVQFVHPPKKHEWQQRVIRIYDPDFHMIEIGESMEVIAKRLHKAEPPFEVVLLFCIACGKAKLTPLEKRSQPAA